MSSSERDKDSIAADHLVVTNLMSFGLSEIPGASETSAISEQLRIEMDSFYLSIIISLTYKGENDPSENLKIIVLHVTWHN